MRILAISDLHTDFRKNWELIKQIPDTRYRDDILIVAGDIASQPEIIRNTLELLQEKFREVCYVPGNHELWVQKEHKNSIEKFFHVLELCKNLGVHTSPMCFENVWVVPLFSWYSSDFSDNGHEYHYQLRGWTDFYACHWPEELENVSDYFGQLNEQHLHEHEEPVISFSHFLPRLDLLPPREFLFFKALPEVAGSLHLEPQIRQIQSIIHVFGHSHIPRDVLIHGVRYVQNPLASPRWRGDRTAFPEKIIWDTS